ncbi:MAG: HD domain-containing protein [Pyrinomonadaceae bacterium]
MAQAADVPLSHGLKEAMSRSLRVIDRAFCSSMEASIEFLKILRRRGRVGRALRAMHEVGFLSRFLPEFGRISLLIQHDLYHHYTVDEHTLRAVDALDELDTSQDKQRQHFRDAFNEVEDPALLYFSVLLHDIGKGQGSGHVARGVDISARICERMQLSAEATAVVLLLVKYHTTMAQISQRRDLREAQVATEFASQMGSIDALNMLTLLTYGDLNGVGPGVWSDWKGLLLWELYERTRVVLAGGHDDLLASMDSDGRGKFAHLKEEVMNLLEGKIPLSEIERHFALLPERYARIVDAQVVANHLRLIEQLKADVLSTSWKQRGKSATELTVCTLDRHGLFADLAGTMAAQGVEILGAELNTREDGLALDVFVIRETATHHALPEYKWSQVEQALGAAIKGEMDVAATVERWRTKSAPRRSKPLPARAKRQPHVVGDNDVAQGATVFEVRAIDEPGFAYKIASALGALNLDIVCARVTTEKSDALDVFYVTDATGAKLPEATLRSVEIELTRRLSLNETLTPGETPKT